MTIRNIKAMIAALLLALLVCFGAVMGGQGNLSAFAATDVQTAYENTNVLDNLEGSTIGGKTFDITDYPHNDIGNPQIISLVEFCYSYYADRQSDYGLYVYVYKLCRAVLLAYGVPALVVFGHAPGLGCTAVRSHPRAALSAIHALAQKVGVVGDMVAVAVGVYPLFATLE